MRGYIPMKKYIITFLNNQTTVATEGRYNKMNKAHIKQCTIVDDKPKLEKSNSRTFTDFTTNELKQVVDDMTDEQKAETLLYLKRDRQHILSEITYRYGGNTFDSDETDANNFTLNRREYMRLMGHVKSLEYRIAIIQGFGSLPKNDKPIEQKSIVKTFSEYHDRSTKTISETPSLAY